MLSQSCYLTKFRFWLLLKTICVETNGFIEYDREQVGPPTTTCSGTTTTLTQTSCSASRTSCVTRTYAAPAPSASPPPPTMPTWWPSGRAITSWRRNTTQARAATNLAAPRTARPAPWRAPSPCTTRPRRLCTLLNLPMTPGNYQICYKRDIHSSTLLILHLNSIGPPSL